MIKLPILSDLDSSVVREIRLAKLRINRTIKLYFKASLYDYDHLSSLIQINKSNKMKPKMITHVNNTRKNDYDTLILYKND